MAFHPKENLLDYVDGALEPPDRTAVERHLETCADCREHVAFIRSFKSGIGELAEEEFTTREPFPDSWTLVSYEAGEVDEETAKHLRAHLLFCDQCADEFYALRQFRAAEEAVARPWPALLAKLKKYAIDLAKEYGPGVLLGPVRIVGEQSAFAMRGEAGAAEKLSKVLELSVSENMYTIEVALSGDRSVSCDIAGFETPRKHPLKITIRSLEGRELFATETDDNGNASFVLEPRYVPTDAFVLSLTLGKAASHLLLQIPGEAM